MNKKKLTIKELKINSDTLQRIVNDMEQFQLEAINGKNRRDKILFKEICNHFRHYIADVQTEIIEEHKQAKVKKKNKIIICEDDEGLHPLVYEN